MLRRRREAESLFRAYVRAIKLLLMNMNRPAACGWMFKPTVALEGDEQGFGRSKAGLVLYLQRLRLAFKAIIDCGWPPVTPFRLFLAYFG
jgi:hypothetical protein